MNAPVLIVIDMQNDFLASWEQGRRHALVQGINELVGHFRSRSLPIIWVRQEFESDLSDAFPEMKAKGIRTVIKGTPGSQIDSELAADPSDTALVKKRYSAFFGTDLDEKLARFKPDTIILAGINTHACIRTTAIDTYQRDWPVVLALDCIGSYDRKHHEVSLSYMKDKIAAVLTNREIEAALQTRP
jgi:nicotinamidase-related amidase